MIEAVCLVDGLRSPFCKRSLRFNPIASVAAMLVEELFIRNQVQSVDEIIFSSYCMENILEDCLQKLEKSIPSTSLKSLCGLEALELGMQKIQSGQNDSVLIINAESVNQMPFLWHEDCSRIFRSRKLSDWLELRPHHFFAINALEHLQKESQKSASSMAKAVSLSEEEKIAYLEESKTKAKETSQVFEKQILPIPLAPSYSSHQTHDECGQFCDGAIALLLARENLYENNMGYLLETKKVFAKDFAMLRATDALLEKSAKAVEHFDFFDFDESSVESVLAQKKAFETEEICQKLLAKTYGNIDKFNPIGGCQSFGDSLGSNALCQILRAFAILEEREYKAALIASEAKQMGMAISIEKE